MTRGSSSSSPTKRRTQTPGWFLILTRRRTVTIFVTVLLCVELLMMLMHEILLLPPASTSGDRQHETNMIRRTNDNNNDTRATDVVISNRLAAVTNVLRQQQKQNISPGRRRAKLVLSEHKTESIVDEKPISPKSYAIATNHNNNLQQKQLAAFRDGNVTRQGRIITHERVGKIVLDNNRKQQTMKQKKSIAENTNDQIKDAKKRKQGWDPGAEGVGKDPIPLKIHTPVFVASLPKSATTSIWQYFNCGGHVASHQYVKTISGETKHAGKCVKENIDAGQPPFAGCGDYNVYTDTGFALHVSTGVADCYYPSISALDSIYEHYPNATIVLMVRNTMSWFNSMETWGNGTLLKRWRFCNMTEFVQSNKVDDLRAFQTFYEWHTSYVRNFAISHPSLT